MILIYGGVNSNITCYSWKLILAEHEQNTYLYQNTNTLTLHSHVHHRVEIPKLTIDSVKTGASIMSMIEKLLIQGTVKIIRPRYIIIVKGVRCYAPGEDQRVVITFRTPLTVIFGANGTGKTVKIYQKLHALLHNAADHH